MPPPSSQTKTKNKQTKTTKTNKPKPKQTKSGFFFYRLIDEISSGRNRRATFSIGAFNDHASVCIHPFSSLIYISTLGLFANTHLTKTKLARLLSFVDQCLPRLAGFCQSSRDCTHHGEFLRGQSYQIR